MTPEQLRALQAPIKQRYRDDPSSALVTLRVQGTIDPEAITCRVESAHQGPIVAGLHPSAGGDGSAACSGDMLLESLVACAGVTLGAVATAKGLTVRSGTIEAKADWDVRGTLGVSKAAPIGLSHIRLQFQLDTDADDDQLAQLIGLTERYCVILQTLQDQHHVKTEIVRENGG